jgi:outer membrane protein
MNPVLVLAGLFPATQSGPKLTLDDALTLGDRNAFAILLSQSALEKQRQLSSKSASALGPTAAISGNYTRFDRATSASFGNQSFTTVPIDEKSVSGSLTWLLDISGNSRRLLKASKAQILAQTQTLESTRNDTRQSIRTAYLNVLRAKAQVAVAEEAMASDSERVRVTKLQLDQGTVAKVDLLRAQTQQAQSQTDLLTANNQLALAKQILNFAVARPIEAPLEVVDVPAAPDLEIDETRLAREANQTRPDVRALETTQTALAVIRRATEGTFNPNLTFSLTHTRNIAVQGFGTRDQSTTGVLALNIPVYDGGATRDNVKAARQDEAQNKIRLDQLRLNVSLEVHQAATNYQNAASRLGVAEANIVTAKEALRLADLKRAEGLGTLQEVLDARTALTQAETSAVTARYDALQAVADLQRALGTDRLPIRIATAVAPKAPGGQA